MLSISFSLPDFYGCLLLLHEAVKKGENGMQHDDECDDVEVQVLFCFASCFVTHFSRDFICLFFMPHHLLT